MNSAKTWAIVVLTLTTLGGGWLAWTERAELSVLRAAAMPRDERAELQRRAWELEKANRELRQQLTARKEPAAEGAAPGARPARGEAAARRDPDQQLAAMREAFAKPEVQALFAAQERGGIEARYAAFFRGLNLPPDQVARLAALLTERRTALLDISAVARDQGIDLRANSPALQQLVAKTQEEINQSIRGVIGEAGFTQLTAYEQTAAQRNTVAELQQRLSYTAAPLTAAQADQLVQILAANPEPRPAAARPPAAAATPAIPAVPEVAALRVLGGSPGGGTAAITPAAVAQSQSVLSQPQLAALQQMQQQQQAQQQLRQIVADALGNPPGAGQPPARTGKQ